MQTVLALLKKTIFSRSSYVFVRLYKALVIAVLDFGLCIASLKYRGAMLLLEEMQRQQQR
jgi:hypothetical protein